MYPLLPSQGKRGHPEAKITFLQPAKHRHPAGARCRRERFGTVPQARHLDDDVLVEEPLRRHWTVGTAPSEELESENTKLKCLLAKTSAARR